jgi:hypothetical protein
MNIETLKKKLEAFVFRPVEGESWEFVWERQRELKPNHLMFWQVLIRVLRRFLVKIFSVALTAGEQFAVILGFSLSGTIEGGWIILLEAPSKIESPRYGYASPPPKIFVPLPDAETGGCARNDSVTAPAIN